MKKLTLPVLLATCAVQSFAVTKIACIGNSITYGYRLPNPSTQSYPGKLQALLGTADFSVQNDGVGSATVSKKGDVPYWSKGKLPEVFAFAPDIITIKLGTNDSKPKNWDGLGYGTQFKKDYLAMIDTLAVMASRPKIFCILPVPVFENPTAVRLGIRDSVIQKEIAIIKEVAASRGLPVIDANAPLLNFPQYFSVDGVHPDAAGEDTIARILYRALNSTAASEPFSPRLSYDTKGNGITGSPPGATSSPMKIFGVSGKSLGAGVLPSLPRRGEGNPASAIYVVRRKGKTAFLVETLRK